MDSSNMSIIFLLDHMTPVKSIISRLEERSIRRVAIWLRMFCSFGYSYW